MLDIVLSIAPVFLLIVFGWWLRQGVFDSAEFWRFADKLVYWILFPALLFHKTSTLTLSGAWVGSYASVIYGGFFAAVAFALLSGAALRLSGPTGSSVLQGAVRHNTFIALAVSERLMGAEGLTMAALATSLLIPVTNVTIVSLMTVMIRADGEVRGAAVARAVLRDLARNPLILSVGAGVTVNVLGIGTIPVVHDVVDVLGRAALPIVLLCVGANLQTRGLRAALPPMAAATIGKLVVFPAVACGVLLALGMTGVPALVAMVYASVPTASSAYTLARQMGGDAPLMATIVTVQTFISFVTLPASVIIAQGIFQ